MKSLSFPPYRSNISSFLCQFFTFTQLVAYVPVVSYVYIRCPSRRAGGSPLGGAEPYRCHSIAIVSFLQTQRSVLANLLRFPHRAPESSRRSSDLRSPLLPRVWEWLLAKRVRKRVRVSVPAFRKKKLLQKEGFAIGRQNANQLKVT